jgi:dUTP pyrophosphatase
MKITLDKNAKIPYRAHTFDGGADLCAKDGGVVLPYGGMLSIDTGVHVQIPESCVGIVKGRSGLAFKHGVFCHEGTVDYGYTGSIRVLLVNMGEEPYLVKSGDRIAQLLIQPVVLTPFELVDELEMTDRGDSGFGSTGV